MRAELLKDRCDWINFNMNVPHASHGWYKGKTETYSEKYIISAT